MNPDTQKTALEQPLIEAEPSLVERSSEEKARILARLQIGLAQIRAAQEVKHADA